MNIGGDLNTGGDVISISRIGAGSNIAAGKGASVKVTTTSGDADKFHELAAWRKSIEKAIHDNVNLDRDEKEEVGEQIEKVERELIKTDINTKKIEKILNILQVMSTDIYKIAIETITHPLASLGLRMKEMGDKVKIELQDSEEG
jgi:hypothetical protein